MSEPRFKVGDMVRLCEPYRTRRLANPRDPVANAAQVRVSEVYMTTDWSTNSKGFSLSLEGFGRGWMEKAFEPVTGPW